MKPICHLALQRSPPLSDCHSSFCSRISTLTWAVQSATLQPVLIRSHGVKNHSLIFFSSELNPRLSFSSFLHRPTSTHFTPHNERNGSPERAQKERWRGQNNRPCGASRRPSTLTSGPRRGRCPPTARRARSSRMGSRLPPLLSRRVERRHHRQRQRRPSLSLPGARPACCS